MEPITILGILLIGLIAGAVAAGALLRGNKGPNFAASEAELADLKSRLRGSLLLAGEDGIEVVGEASTGLEAVEKPFASTPPSS